MLQNLEIYPRGQRIKIIPISQHWFLKTTIQYWWVVVIEVCYAILKQHRIGMINTLWPRQNFADDTFKCIFLHENDRISIKISLKFVPKVPINNIPALVQIMAWRRSGDKPLSEPMRISFPTHICVTRSPRVKVCVQILEEAGDKVVQHG